MSLMLCSAHTLNTLEVKKITRNSNDNGRLNSTIVDHCRRAMIQTKFWPYQMILSSIPNKFFIEFNSFASSRYHHSVRIEKLNERRSCSSIDIISESVTSWIFLCCWIFLYSVLGGGKKNQKSSKVLFKSLTNLRSKWRLIRFRRETSTLVSSDLSWSNFNANSRWKQNVKNARIQNNLNLVETPNARIINL